MVKALVELTVKDEVESCFLCLDPSCTKNCEYHMDPGKVLRSMRFDNRSGAEIQADYGSVCSECDSLSCMEGCIKNALDRPVNIHKVMTHFKRPDIRTTKGSVDLTIDFCGIPCENPYFLSSSVVASNYEMIAKAFDMGWAGVAYKTIGLFVPEEVSPRFAVIKKEGSSFIGFKNIEQISDNGLEENLLILRRLKEDYPNKVIIASILGQDEEEWTYLAKRVTEAGVDIIECNFSCPHMSGEGLGSDVGQDPELVALYTRAVRKGTPLPILAKMTPNVGNMEVPALAAIEAGADGIAAINTIKSIMNIDLEDFGSEPKVEGRSSVGGYSGKTVKPIALRFIHDMMKHPMLTEIPMSGMGGIETWRDGAEFLALGCTNLQITTAVMQYGYRIIEDLIEGLSMYLHEKGYHSLREMVGLALPQVVSADALNRQTIVYPKIHREGCISCGRCYVSCYDGGHQALELNDEGKPLLLSKRCVGCHLCVLVCPVDAITSTGKRVPIRSLI